MKFIVSALVVVTLVPFGLQETPVRSAEPSRNSFTAFGAVAAPPNRAQSRISKSPVACNGINVVDYGADPSFVNDSTTAFQYAVNAAVNSAPAILMNTVCVPEGKYALSSTVYVGNGGPGAGIVKIVLKGAGMNNSRLIWTGHNHGGPMLQSVTNRDTGQANVAFDVLDMGFDSNGTTAIPDGFISISNSGIFEIARNYFGHAFNPIYLYNDLLSQVDQNYFNWCMADCLVLANTANGIHIYDNEFASYQRYAIYSPPPSRLYGPGSAANSDNLLIQMNDFEGYSHPPCKNPSFSRSSNVVTVRCGSPLPHPVSVGETAVVTGVSDSSFKGNFPICGSATPGCSDPTNTTFTYQQTARNAASSGGSTWVTSVAAIYLYNGHGNTLMSNRFEDGCLSGGNPDTTYRSIYIDTSSATVISMNLWAAPGTCQHLIQLDSTTSSQTQGVRLIANQGGCPASGFPVIANHSQGIVSIGDMWNCAGVITGAVSPKTWYSIGGDNVTGSTGLINSSYFKVLDRGDQGNATGSPLLDLVGKHITNAASAPTSGTWKAGDFVLNSLFDPNVAAENIIGWYCSAGGTPGKWVALAAVQQVKGAPTGACQTGSIRSRYDGGAHSTLYVCENGKWAAK